MTNTIRELARGNNFEEKLRKLIQAGDKVRMAFDKTKNIICSRASNKSLNDPIKTDIKKNI